MSDAKPKVAFYWNASCGGCEEAVIDLAEKILDVVAAVDIVFWPVALDYKISDVEKHADGSIAVSFINGSVRTSEQEKVCKLLRKKSGLVVAFGSCSHLGGIPGLANFWNRETIFKYVYQDAPSVVNEKGIRPLTESEDEGRHLELPTFWNTVERLDAVIDVDYYLPGCAPPPDLIMEAINAILTGNLPAKGAILSPNRNLCDTCPKEKTGEMLVTEFKRPHEVFVDPDRCLLEQGILCLGPVTRTGCGERCMRVDMPCRGCFGPTDQVKDPGAKFLSAVASMINSNDPDEIEKIVDTIPDFAGLFYRFSLPTSALKRKNMGGAQ